MAAFALIGPIATLIDDCVKRVFPDKTEAERISMQLQTALLQADVSIILGQLQVNAEEAKSQSLFVAGWRPAVGWVCASALGYNYVLQPFFAFVIGAFAWQLPPLPTLDAGVVMSLMTGMLGLSGMRSYEKVNGKSNGH